MIYKINFTFTILYISIPLFLITGPAIPDIIISLGGIFGLTYIIVTKNKTGLNKIRFFQISFFFWIALIYTSFFAKNFEKSIQDSLIFLRYLMIPICCYFIFFNKEHFLRYLLLLSMALTFFVSIDTLFQFFSYTTIDGFGPDLFGFKSNWYGRLTGPFADELIPGSYISKFGLVGFVYFLIIKDFKYKNFFQTFYLSLILVTCFVSGERMAFATYLLALVLLFLFLNKERKILFKSILVGIFCIIAIYKFHPFYNDFEIIENKEIHKGLKVEKKFKCENDDTTCVKVVYLQPSFFQIIRNFETSAYGEIYLLSYEMFKDNPITGIGISNFKFLCNNEMKYKKMMLNYECATHPHNIYIQWLTEGGIVIFFIFLIYIISICNLVIKNNGDLKFKIISLTLLVILFWPIMSTGSLIKNWYGISVFFIIGISMCLSRIKQNS